MKHNLYIIEFNEVNYDQYDKFLVSADSKKECKTTVYNEHNNESYSGVDWKGGFTIKLIGETNKKKSIIMESFNAG